MARCIVESKHAYEAGDRDRAKTLSNERKAHKAKMDQLNLEAGAWIYASKSRCFSHRRSPDDLTCLSPPIFRSENNEASLAFPSVIGWVSYMISTVIRTAPPERLTCTAYTYQRRSSTPVGPLRLLKVVVMPLSIS